MGIGSQNVKTVAMFLFGNRGPRGFLVVHMQSENGII